MLDSLIKYFVPLLTVALLSSCDYCKIAEEIANEEVIGVVESKKKLEWNRDEQTIIYKDLSNQIRNYGILMDNSGLWGFVEKGDSLYKPMNVKLMKVYRKGEFAGEFLMDIGCINT